MASENATELFGFIEKENISTWEVNAHAFFQKNVFGRLRERELSNSGLSLL